MAPPRGFTECPSKPKRGKRLAVEELGVIYARYSSHAQKDKSIEQQVEEDQALANEFGIRIVGIYADRAVTGRTDKRKDFQRMMRELPKMPQVRYVIAWKSNRIGRNMLEAMINEAKLQDMGIRVLYVEEDFDDTAAGRFAARSMMNVNQFYSENMAEDIRRGMYDNAKQCMITNGHLPFGFKKGEDMKYAIDEPKAAIVWEIFSRVACGEPFVDIANDLNSRGIKTSRGGLWGKNSFHVLLTNERYRGIYIYDDIRIDGGVPRIVSDALFWKVQEVLKTKKNAQGRHRVFGDYLLTGKLFCGLCKSPMVGISGTSKTKDRHYYYTCKKRQTDKSCKKENVRRDAIERQVAMAIKSYALQDDVIEWIADSTVAYNERQEAQSHIAILTEELDGVKKSTKNLLAAIEAGIITDTTKGRLLELEAQQSQLAVKIEAERADLITVPRKDISAGLAMFRDGDIEDKRYQAKLFDTFLVAVYLYDGNMKIVFSFSGSKNTVDVPLEDVVDAVEPEYDASGRVRINSPLVHQNKKSRRIFGEKTKSFQGFQGPWISEIQGPCIIDIKPLSIHSMGIRTHGTDGGRTTAASGISRIPHRSHAPAGPLSGAERPAPFLKDEKGYHNYPKEKGGTGSTMTTEEKSRYFQELTLDLQHEGFTAGVEADGLLPVDLDGRHLCRVTADGEVRYLKEDVAGDGRSAALERTIDIARTTAEYMSQMETASQLTASGLTGDYRLLAEFNGTVLAGHPTQYGVQFVTWEWVQARTALHQGDYYGPDAGVESYAAAKQDFAVRSGLILRSALFAPEQLAEVYRSIHETLEGGYPMSVEREKILESVAEQIEQAAPDLQERIDLSKQKEVEAGMQYGQTM